MHQQSESQEAASINDPIPTPAGCDSIKYVPSSMRLHDFRTGPKKEADHIRRWRLLGDHS